MASVNCSNCNPKINNDRVNSLEYLNCPNCNPRDYRTVYYTPSTTIKSEPSAQYQEKKLFFKVENLTWAGKSKIQSMLNLINSLTLIDAAAGSP